MFHLKRQISLNVILINESVILAMKTGYSDILQSVESDKRVLEKEWKSINWKSLGYAIFKIQKRIFEAEKVGEYRKVNSLCRLLVNDKRSLLYAIYVVTKRNKGKPEGLGKDGAYQVLTGGAI